MSRLVETLEISHVQPNASSHGVPSIEVVSELANATGTKASVGVYEQTLGTLSSQRIYPHLYDEASSAGKAMELLSQARRDVSAALDAFGVPDLDAVATRLTYVAAEAARAVLLIDFNPNLSSVVSFIRRASLAASAAEVTRPALNALASSLSYLIDHPALDLMQSAEIANNLESEGWNGQHRPIEVLLRELLHGKEATDEEQRELFDLLKNMATEGGN